MNASGKNAFLIALLAAVLAVPILLPFIGYRNLITADNDCLYHFHRIQLCLEDFPKVLSVDMFSHFPDGFRVHWPATCTLAYTAITKLAGLGAESLALERFLSCLSILDGMLVAFLVTILAWKLFPSSPGRWLAAAAFLLCSLSFSLLFQYGRIDHHQFSTLAMLISMMAILISCPILWCAAFLLQFLMTPEALFFSTIIMACFAGSELWRQGNGARGKPSVFWHFVPAAAALAALAANHTVESDPLPWLSVSWQGASIFQPLWMLFLGVISYSLSWRFYLLPLENNRKLWWRQLLISAFVVIGLGILILIFSGQLQPILGRFFEKRGIIVGEETCPLKFVFELTPWYLINLLLVPWIIIRLCQSFRDEFSPPSRVFFWILMLAGILLSYYEIRFFLACGPMLALPLADLVCSSAAFVGKTRVLPRENVRKITQASFFVIVLVAGIIISLAARGNRMPVREKRLELMIKWFQDSNIRPKVKAHSQKPEYGVLGPWTIGHSLHILAGQPVMTDPFNHIDVPRIMSELYLCKSPDELKKVLEKYQSRYLIVSYPHDSLLNADASWRSSVAEYNKKNNGLYPEDLNKFAYFRLYITSGFGMEFPFLQLRYLAPVKISTQQRQSSSVHYPELLSLDMIYELKPGAKLSGNAPPGAKTVRISFVVAEKYGEKEALYEIVHVIKVRPNGEFCYKTALPIPVKEKYFRIEGGYRLSSGDKTALVPLSQEAVDKGETVPVSWQD